MALVETPSPDARAAIDESIALRKTVTLEYLRDMVELDETVASLERLAEGSTTDGSTREFWGTDAGGKWRVRVEISEHR